MEKTTKPPSWPPSRFWRRYCRRNPNPKISRVRREWKPKLTTLKPTLGHYVRIVRRGYGLEGIRAHTHYTRKARIFKHVREKERCMGKPESTPSHKENECTRGKFTHRHTRKRLTYTHKWQFSECLCERKGAWASPNQPLVTRRMNAREEGLHTDTQGKGLHTHTDDKFLNAFVKGEVHGQARTHPYYWESNSTSHRYGVHTSQWTIY